MSRQRETQTTQRNGQLVKGLRRRPLTAKTRVRFPYWLLTNSGKQMIRISILVIFFARSNGVGQKCKCMLEINLKFVYNTEQMFMAEAIVCRRYT